MASTSCPNICHLTSTMETRGGCYISILASRIVAGVPTRALNGFFKVFFVVILRNPQDILVLPREPSMPITVVQEHCCSVSDSVLTGDKLDVNLPVA